MTKYNLSAIMKRAWELVKKAGMTISAGLKKAWKEAKEAMESLHSKVIAELNSLINKAADVYDYEIREKLWEKYGKSRTYFKIVETRKCSKHYAEYDFGYIDNHADEYHAGKKDAFGKYDLAGNVR